MKHKGQEAGDAKRPLSLVVRVSPRLRYLAEIAARQQRRTVSSFAEWAIERALYEVELEDKLDPKARGERTTVGALRDRLWDVNEAERFAILALYYPGLLTHEEQVLWKLITNSAHLWLSPTDQFVEIDLRLKLASSWETLKKVARGELPETALRQLGGKPAVASAETAQVSDPSGDKDG